MGKADYQDSMYSYSSDTRLNQNSKFTLLTSRLSSLILKELHTYTAFKVNWACDRDMIIWYHIVNAEWCIHDKFGDGSWFVLKWSFLIRRTPERYIDMLWFPYTKDFRDHVKWYKPHTSKSNLTSVIKRVLKEVTLLSRNIHTYISPFYRLLAQQICLF